MRSVVDLARPEVRALEAYVPASYAEGAVRLNANESPWRSDGDGTPVGMHRYPAARPFALTRTLAHHFGIDPARVFVTRGSSEAIDLLIRSFCRPGIDRIVISPPTFGMYSVYANLQGAGVKSIPLRKEQGFALPVEEIAASWSGVDRLLFVTSPNNPTGNAQPISAIAQCAEALNGRGIVVLDAAYAEFTDVEALMDLLRFDNVVVLRTLSKAYGLAGARCGAALATPALVELLARAMPPYAVPTPSTETALAVMADDALASMPRRIRDIVEERGRMAEALAMMRSVVKVYPSDANFLLVDFHNPKQVLSASAEAGLLLRDFSDSPYTPNCLRITIGTPQDNNRVLRVVENLSAQAHAQVRP